MAMVLQVIQHVCGINYWYMLVSRSKDSLQGPEAAETKVTASAMCTLLLAEQHRRCAASSTLARDADQQQQQQQQRSVASSQPEDEATASHGSQAMGDAVWEHAHQTLQALSQLEAAGPPELSGQQTASILQRTASVFELVTELLFMAGLHGKAIYTGSLPECQLLSSTYALCITICSYICTSSPVQGQR